jgi:plasmid stabilization system protein ParE
LIALKASADLDLAADLLANAEEEEDAELAEQRIEDALEALLDAEIAGNDDDTVILSTKLSAYYLIQLLLSHNERLILLFFGLYSDCAG